MKADKITLEVANHLRPFMDMREAKCVVKKSIAILRAYDFDAIAFRGLSGALIAPIIAMQMGKSLLAVRKDEKTHSIHKVEGDISARRYIIVDDFIATGSTVRAILKHVKDFSGAKCIGVLQAYYLAPDMDVHNATYEEHLVTEIVTSWEEEQKEVYS